MLDPSLGILLISAISCIWYGAYRSYHFFNSKEEDKTVKEIPFMESSKVIFLPIVGSIVLLVLFFFLDSSITIYILYVLISIVVLSSQFFVFAPLVDHISSKISKEPKGFTVPKIGFIPFSGIFLFLYCAGVIIAWIMTGHWIVVDAIAICLGITQMSVLRLPSLKISVLLLVPFLFYDVFWVFISPLFFHGTSVMVSVAERLPPLPLLLKIPRVTDNDNSYSILGLGDIALPGIFMVFLYHFDKYLGKEEKIQLKNMRGSYLGYFSLSLVEYTLGFIATLTSGYIMKSGQPALLFLVPFTVGPTAFIAWRRGDLNLMWRGPFTSTTETKEKSQELQGLLEEGERETEEEEENKNTNENGNQHQNENQNENRRGDDNV